MAQGFLGGTVVKNLPANVGDARDWVRKILWRRKWQPTPVFLPGKSHGQRSLVGYSPWGRKESDTIDHTHTHTHTHIHTWQLRGLEMHVLGTEGKPSRWCIVFFCDLVMSLMVSCPLHSIPLKKSLRPACDQGEFEFRLHISWEKCQQTCKDISKPLLNQSLYWKFCNIN